MCENSVEYVEKLLYIWNSGDCAVLLDWRIPFETAYLDGGDYKGIDNTLSASGSESMCELNSPKILP